MDARIDMYKGFVMIDSHGNQQLYNKLRESTFLTMHPRGGKFFCMANNAGLQFMKAYWKFFSKNFQVSTDVEEFVEQEEIEYVEKHEKKLKIPTFEGITWKQHQKNALDLISRYKQYCIFLGPGTGKTLIALGAIKMLETIKFRGPNDPNRHNYLVVTPKKAIPQYVGEIKKYFPKANVATKVADKIIFSTSGFEAPRIAVVNYESIDKWTDIHYDAMILDESHKAKNVSSEINKTLCKILSENTYLFTGTPQDKQRDEVFAQLKILNPNLLSLKTLFYSRFFILDDYYKPIKEKHSDELEEIITKCSYGDKTENLIDLPKENEFVLPVELGPLKDTYKKFKKDKVLKGKDWYTLGDSGAKHRTKLTQLCSGFIYDEEGKAHRTPYNPKAEGLLGLILKTKKAIIYTTYNEEQVIVEEILKKAKAKYVIVNGQSKDAAESLEKFKDGKTDFLVIQIVSGNAALDFPHINNVIYYSLHDSYIYFEQSKYRIRRIGQTKECNYYYLIVKGTVESHRLRSLKNKKSFNNREFELYKRRDNDES
ncbi:MAG: DEAD/DEAH box helicase family protein [Gammaproteobacteria bacterium]|nr:DEAD/DEAH box helicase family protein [Gammaproteobacteria bacterium]